MQRKSDIKTFLSLVLWTLMQSVSMLIAILSIVIVLKKKYICAAVCDREFIRS